MRYNIDFSIAGVVFLVLYYIFYKLQYTDDTVKNRRFRQILIALLCADLFDLITAVTISYSQIIPVWVNYVLNVLYFISGTLPTYILTDYITYFDTDRDTTRTSRKINLVLYLSYTVLCLSSPFTHLMFYFDENAEYQHGLLYILLFAMPLYFMIYALIMVIRRRANITKKAFIVIITFITLTNVGTLLQLLVFKTYLLSYFSAAASAFGILTAMDAPDYLKMVKTMEELKESRAELEAARIKDKQRTHTSHEILKAASWVLYFGETGEVTGADWSEEFAIMLGYTAEEVKEQLYDLWSNSLHPDDYESALASFRDGMMGVRPYNTRFRLRHKDGTYLWYRGSGELTYDEDGRVTSYQGIIQDIEDEIEKELLNKEKEEALEKLEKSQKELEQALEAAEEASRAKSSFLTNMSHDIRTPMNAIVGFTDLAIANIDNKEEAVDYLEKIQTSSAHLLMLINDILDMSRIESGKVTLKPERCDLLKMVDNLEAVFQADVQSHGLTFVKDTSELHDNIVICDKLRLNQVFMNCLGNSVKFTPAGGRIGISVHQDDTRYVFKIFDTGIGMSEDFIKRIFEPFERERTSTISKTEGTGLGMSITKNVVDMMGGKIEIQSKQDVGTTFIITIPLEFIPAGMNQKTVSEEEQRAELSTEEKAAALKGRHLMVVDDNKANRMVAKGVLGFYGITTDEVADGSEAIEVLRASDPDTYDLILMDVQMPIMNGYDATDAIRAMDDKDKACLPVIAMTANAFDEDRAECLRHGMNGHIAKPFKKEEIIDVLYKTLCR